MYWRSQIVAIVVLVCGVCGAELGKDWSKPGSLTGWVNGSYDPTMSLNGKIYILGPGDSNTVISSQGGGGWTVDVAAAEWPRRDYPGGIAFNGKLWIYGGNPYNTSTVLNDVWSSTDGKTWSRATSQAGWRARGNMGSVVHNGKMFILGGNHSISFTKHAVYSDVWSSSDGANWTLVTDTAGWTARIQPGVASLNGRIYVVGGNVSVGDSFDDYELANDVWSSADGATWRLETNDAPWSARAAMGCVAFNGKLWVLGGGSAGDDKYENDVWYSSDGKTWQQATGAAPWRGRYGMTALSHAGKMFLVGGASSSGAAPGDSAPVWYSEVGGAGEGEGEGEGEDNPLRDAAQRVLDAFDRIDSNGDGQLSKAELAAAGNALSAEVFSALDTNSDGRVSVTELQATGAQLPSALGCNCGEAKDYGLKLLGDYALLAASMIALVAMSRLKHWL